MSWIQPIHRLHPYQSITSSSCTQFSTSLLILPLCRLVQWDVAQHTFVSGIILDKLHLVLLTNNNLVLSTSFLLHLPLTFPPPAFTPLSLARPNSHPDRRGGAEEEGPDPAPQGRGGAARGAEGGAQAPPDRRAEPGDLHAGGGAPQDLRRLLLRLLPLQGQPHHITLPCPTWPDMSPKKPYGSS